MKLLFMIFSMLLFYSSENNQEFSIVESIEEKHVILESRGKYYFILKELFPVHIEVGDVVKRRSVFYIPDKDETAKRKMEIQKLEEEVWN